MLESAEERVGVGKAEQVSDFGEFQGLVREVMMGQLLTGFLEQLLKGDAQTGELPLERAGAQAQGARHVLERGSSASEQALGGGF